MEFENEENIDTEGELIFPMPDGASLCGYAIDIDGTLVEGVIVEKEKARVTFEAEARKEVSHRPTASIAEHVVGNVFKTRVYPLLKLSKRLIRVSYVEELSSTASSDTEFSLPISTTRPLDRFSFISNIQVELEDGKVRRQQSQKAPAIKLDTLGPNGDVFDEISSQRVSTSYSSASNSIVVSRYCYRHEKQNCSLSQGVKITIPQGGNQQYIIERDPETGDVFVAVNDSSFRPLKQSSNSSSKKPEIRIGILWDASGSRAKINHQLEFDLLRAVTSKHTKCIIDLYIFNIEVQKMSSFEVQNGNVSDVLGYLQSQVSYFGGSNLRALPFGKFPQHELSREGYAYLMLFTDGFHTMGPEPLPKEIEAPVYVISAGQLVNTSLGKILARRSGGAFFELNNSSAVSSISKSIGETALSFLNAIKEDAIVGDVFPSIPTAVETANSLRLAAKISSAKLKRGEATATTLTINYGFGTTTTLSTSLDVVIPPLDTLSSSGLVSRFWAQRQIDELGLFPEIAENDSLIFQIGKRFGIVTSNASLIVLEELDQYLKYDIEPPAELPNIKRDWLRLKRQLREAESEKSEEKILHVLDLWRRRIAWWNEDMACAETSQRIWLHHCAFGHGVDPMETLMPDASQVQHVSHDFPMEIDTGANGLPQTESGMSTLLLNQLLADLKTVKLPGDRPGLHLTGQTQFFIHSMDKSSAVEEEKEKEKKEEERHDRKFEEDKGRKENSDSKKKSKKMKSEAKPLSMSRSRDRARSRSPPARSRMDTTDGDDDMVVHPWKVVQEKSMAAEEIDEDASGFAFTAEEEEEAAPEPEPLFLESAVADMPYAPPEEPVSMGGKFREPEKPARLLVSKPAAPVARQPIQQQQQQQQQLQLQQQPQQPMAPPKMQPSLKALSDQRAPVPQAPAGYGAAAPARPMPRSVAMPAPMSAPAPARGPMPSMPPMPTAQAPIAMSGAPMAAFAAAAALSAPQQAQLGLGGPPPMMPSMAPMESMAPAVYGGLPPPPPPAALSRASVAPPLPEPAKLAERSRAASTRSELRVKESLADESIAQIAKDVEQVRAVFKDMNGLVAEQSEMLDKIDSSVDSAKQDVEYAAQELKQAESFSRRSRQLGAAAPQKLLGAVTSSISSLFGSLASNRRSEPTSTASAPSNTAADLDELIAAPKQKRVGSAGESFPLRPADDEYSGGEALPEGRASSLSNGRGGRGGLVLSGKSGGSRGRGASAVGSRIASEEERKPSPKADSAGYGSGKKSSHLFFGGDSDGDDGISLQDGENTSEIVLDRFGMEKNDMNIPAPEIASQEIEQPPDFSQLLSKLRSIRSSISGSKSALAEPVETPIRFVANELDEEPADEFNPVYSSDVVGQSWKQWRSRQPATWRDFELRHFCTSSDGVFMEQWNRIRFDLNQRRIQSQFEGIASETLSDIHLAEVINQVRKFGSTRQVPKFAVQLFDDKRLAGLSINFHPNRGALTDQVVSAAASRSDINSAFYVESCLWGISNKVDESSVLAVVSCLTELELNNTQYLRIAMYLLSELHSRRPFQSELKFVQLLVEVARLVVKLRPEEPQSHRDLALALALFGNSIADDLRRMRKGPESQDKEARRRRDVVEAEEMQRVVKLYGEALDILQTKVILKKWDARFNQVEIVATNDLNWVLAHARRNLSHFQSASLLGSIDMLSSKVDPRLSEAPLAADLRVVISWDTDMTDVELHVVEPSGEKCCPMHNKTASGGMLSRNFTHGYGPVEYVLKRAPSGTYRVSVKLFHSLPLQSGTTVKVSIFTDFCSAASESSVHQIIHLKQPRQTVDVAEVRIQQTS